MRKLLLAVFLTAFAILGASAAEKKAIRFGLTAVVVRENLRFFDDMTEYLSHHVGQEVVFVRRKSYQEIMELLASGDLDFAWICGYPLVQKREPEFLSLVTVPVYKNQPYYRSYVIVHRDSTVKSIGELKNKVFAYSDPNSNSGYLYPRYHLSTEGHRPDSFFRQTFFTYNHAETVEAVATRFADGGAVESYIWEFLQITNPDLVKKTRVIHESPKFGFPPIVSRNSVAPGIVRRMSETFAQMKDDPDGRKLLGALHLDGFRAYHIDLYEDIRFMSENVAQWTDVSSISGSRISGKQ